MGLVVSCVGHYALMRRCALPEEQRPNMPSSNDEPNELGHSMAWASSTETHHVPVHHPATAITATSGCHPIWHSLRRQSSSTTAGDSAGHLQQCSIPGLTCHSRWFTHLMLPALSLRIPFVDLPRCSVGDNGGKFRRHSNVELCALLGWWQ